MSVSLFDSKARLFAPTHTIDAPARAGAVEAQRLAFNARHDAGYEPALLTQFQSSDIMLGFTRRPSPTDSIP
jgi:hypothetical protein